MGDPKSGLAGLTYDAASVHFKFGTQTRCGAQFLSISVCLALRAKVIWKKNIQHLNMTGLQIDT